MLVPLLARLLIKWRYPIMAARFQPYIAQAATVSALLMLAAALPPASPAIIAGVGEWIIPATVLLALGAVLIGYLLGW